MNHICTVCGEYQSLLCTRCPYKYQTDEDIERNRRREVNNTNEQQEQQLADKC